MTNDGGITTQQHYSAAASTKLNSSKKKQTNINPKQKQQVKNNNNSILRSIQEQYNFKGFGWSINKSLIFAHSIGATLRIPLSANFDCYEQYRAAPFISTGIYFGYPWAVATMLNASLPIEALRWLIAGILYKIQWGMAVMSAITRLCIEVVVYVILWPWRVWSTLLKAMTKVIERSRVIQRQQQQQKQHDVDPTNAAELIVNDTDGGTIVSIETHIELNNNKNNNNSSLNNEVEEDDSVTVVSVIDSPRGGGGGDESGRRRSDGVTSEKIMVPFFLRKEHRTILGHEVPPYHRSTTIEYSSTIQERLGVSMSWRLSKNRGYEYRCNFFFSCMPTRTFWKQLEEERKRRLDSLLLRRRKNEKVLSAMTPPLDVTTTIDDKIGTNNLDSSRYIQNIRSILPSFLTEHYSAVGLSTGWPLPMEPYYALSLVLSMSGFYYGWLMDYIRSILLPSSHHGTFDHRDKKLGSTADNSGKIVSSMLKKKNLPLDNEEVDDNVIEVADNDDDTSIGLKKARAN
jgi:hypothetical protein